MPQNDWETVGSVDFSPALMLCFSFHSIVAFRKANKVGIFIKVTPQREEGEVTVCFKMKHDFKNLAAPIRPVEEGDQGTEVIWLTQHVELSFGPLLP